MNKGINTQNVCSVGGGDMKEERTWTVKEAIRLYYGETNLTDEEEKEVEECLKDMERKGFLEECLKIVREQEKKKIHIGRISLKKSVFVAALIGIVFLFTGFTAIRAYIRSITVKEMGDHSEVVYPDTIDKNALNKIEKYYKPSWIPDGYVMESEFRSEMEYDITYESKNNNWLIYFSQTLPNVNTYYGVEKGIHEKVEFGKYSGEFIESKKANYLVVTDGIYIYSLSSAHLDKETLIRMLDSN